MKNVMKAAFIIAMMPFMNISCGSNGNNSALAEDAASPKDAGLEFKCEDNSYNRWNISTSNSLSSLEFITSEGNALLKNPLVNTKGKKIALKVKTTGNRYLLAGLKTSKVAIDGTITLTGKNLKLSANKSDDLFPLSHVTVIVHPAKDFVEGTVQTELEELGGVEWHLIQNGVKIDGLGLCDLPQFFPIEE